MFFQRAAFIWDVPPKQNMQDIYGDLHNAGICFILQIQAELDHVLMMMQDWLVNTCNESTTIMYVRG